MFKTTHSHVATSAIGELWKTDERKQAGKLPADNRELATSILGTSLVQTLVEEDRQPPDVRDAV